VILLAWITGTLVVQGRSPQSGAAPRSRSPARRANSQSPGHVHPRDGGCTRTALIIGLPALAFALPHWGNLATYSSNPAQLAPYLLMGATYGWARLALQQPVAALRAALGQQHLRHPADHHHLR
jgi:hypothetical protein